MSSPRLWLGKLLVAVLITPVIVMLPLALCMLPFYIPAAAFAQFKAARHGLERDNRWGLRLAAGVAYGIPQYFLLLALLKRWGVDPDQAVVLLLACAGILGTTYLGMIVGDIVWRSAGTRLMTTLRHLYSAERNEDLPPRRLLEAAEWVFFLELPTVTAILLVLAMALLDSQR